MQLSKKMRKLVIGDTRGMNKAEYTVRLRTKWLKTINSLGFLAKHGVEDIQNELFSKNLVEGVVKAKDARRIKVRADYSLLDFLRLLFTMPNKDDVGEQNYERARRRKVKLAFELLSWLGMAQNASKLAPQAKLILQKIDAPRSRNETLNGLQAILLEASL